ncbi:MAG: phosphoribosylglycinamide formyltransferase, partial [Clostridia bacterium]|nr:phosphoribosylglycinamide formyltransferase [Clostridia bacterium]
MTTERVPVAVLVSGGGTNLQALIDAQQAGRLRSGRLALVISNNADAYALERARLAGIPACVITKKACGGQAEMEAAMLRTLREHGIRLIVLAGFMSILSADFVRQYPDRILNVHPALIPS